MLALQDYDSNDSDEDGTSQSPLKVAVQSQGKAGSTDRGPAEMDFFNLNNDDHDTKVTYNKNCEEKTPCHLKTSPNVSQNFNVAGIAVEIADGEFWKNVQSSDIKVSPKSCESSTPKHNMEVSKRNIERNWKRRKLSTWEISNTTQKFESNDGLRNVYSTVPRQTETSAHATGTGTTGNCDRKIYYVHSKIAPHLHTCQNSYFNIPKQRVRECGCHGGIVNRVKWNVSSFSHLVLSAATDCTVKVWNPWSQDVSCVRELRGHEKAVRDAEWSNSGKQVLTCSYDRTARLWDVETGQQMHSISHENFVLCCKYHGADTNLLVTGSLNVVQVYDSRRSLTKPVRAFTHKDSLGQIQDILFSRDAATLFACTDVISRDSADRNIIAWDYTSGVVLSNQIYQERYTCTRLKLHPTDGYFLAQTHGNYIAMFSTSKPYKMNRSKRFDGHQLAGFNLGFDISPDGSTVISGSQDGSVHFYNYMSGKRIRTLAVSRAVCMDVAVHPVLFSTIACCDYDGRVMVWQ